MKKGTIRHNWRHCRKWIATWTVLILILSLISLSAGSGNDTESHENAGTDPDSKIITDKDMQSGEESTGENLESKENLDTDKDNQEPDSETLEERAKESNSTDNQETSEKIQKTESDAEKDTGSQESLEESTGTKTETKQDTGDQENLEKSSGTKEVESGSTDNKKGSEENLETKTETEQDTDNQEIIEKNPEVQTGEKNDISNQESTEENSESKIKGEKSTENQKNAEKGMEDKTEEINDNDYKENAGKSIETGVKTEKDADNQEKPEKKQDTGKVERCSTDKQENSESNLKLKTCPDNKKDSSGNPEKKTEMKTGSCDGSKNLKIEKVKTETKEEACSGTKNSRSEGLEPETRKEACNKENNLKSDDLGAQIKIEGTNFSYIPENKELKPEIKSGKSSWNKLKFILSYPSSLRSFYTTKESVKINYKGSEDLKGQKVDIYLVKTCSTSISEEAVKNITDGTISFEDIFINNPEFYIQIPETLNEGGDLSPMTLGPLPEGSYWVVVTLAEKETKASEPEKTILLAHYFKVFEYELKAAAPRALEEGENLEVDMSLKNAPAQKNYTYWAVLIREDACGTSTDIGSNTSGIKTISGTLLQGLRLIEDFGLNSTDYGSETGRDKFKNEIQAFIGESNGTIIIGEENQNILSLTTSDLHPGNYLLFAGAYENDKGFTGITQKEVSINEARKSHGSNKKQESNTDISTESQNASSMKTEQLVLDTVNSLRLEGLEPQIREETLQAAAVVKNPSKLASFFMGFVGTLLIGIAILKRRR
ncbi:MAG TPA: TIGR04279 domain-containing protein [Methanosarcina sp.]|nr:TIGR04279 domain-containing protein [Methanosarcina sp.]